MPDPPTYDETMLVLFMDQYNEHLVRHGCEAMCWDELPLGVRESISGALNAVIEQVTHDMY